MAMKNEGTYTVALGAMRVQVQATHDSQARQLARDAYKQRHGRYQVPVARVVSRPSWS